MSKRVIAVIPARIDSSRFPAKMIAKETGKPLIQYAWENAIESASVTDVFIATDSDEIATICTDFGAKVIMTGEHPNGTSRIAEAVQNIECDVVVNMQGDEPELSASVIDAAIDVLGDCSMATAACQLQEDELENENVVKICVEKNIPSPLNAVEVDYSLDTESNFSINSNQLSTQSGIFAFNFSN